jgi:hypothetical protein
LENKEHEMKNAKKNAKRVIYLAVLGATVCSSSAWAGFSSYKDYGRGKIDDGTKVMVKQYARNTYDDWLWRGKNEGMQYKCSAATCQASFNIPSKSTSFSQGLNIQPDGFDRQQLTALYNRQYSRTLSTRGESKTAQMRNGQYAQPVAVIKRRWVSGVFNGAHFKDSVGPWYKYEWKWNNFAPWTANHAVGNPYITIIYQKS